MSQPPLMLVETFGFWSLAAPNFHRHYSSVSGHSPTVSEPYETDVNYYYLNVELLDIWIYDDTSGAVHWKGNGQIASLANHLSVDIKVLEQDFSSLRSMPPRNRVALNAEITRLNSAFKQDTSVDSEKFLADITEDVAATSLSRYPPTINTAEITVLIETVPKAPLRVLLERSLQALTDAASYRKQTDEVAKAEILQKYASYQQRTDFPQEERIYRAAIQNFNLAKEIWKLVNADGFKYGPVASSKEVVPTLPASPKRSVTINGVVTSLPNPAYPAAARAVRASGTVSVRVMINEMGSVISASAISGHPLLRPAAEAAARGARFSPTTKDGIPVKAEQTLTYTFVP